MSVLIGQASIDERGKITGGSAGNQSGSGAEYPRLVCQRLDVGPAAKVENHSEKDGGGVPRGRGKSAHRV